MQPGLIVISWFQVYLIGVAHVSRQVNLHSSSNHLLAEKLNKYFGTPSIHLSRHPTCGLRHCEDRFLYLCNSSDQAAEDVRSTILDLTPRVVFLELDKAWPRSQSPLLPLTKILLTSLRQLRPSPFIHSFSKVPHDGFSAGAL